MAPQIAVLAGPNGAGKSTLAPHLLRDLLDIPHFVNADVIAQGLNGFDPEGKALKAGRHMLAELKRLAAEQRDFAFETTLASRTFAPWIDALVADGYEFTLFYVWLPDADAAVRRVARRVERGGHHVPEETIRRRYERGLRNFFELYQPRAHYWQVYNGIEARLVAEGSHAHPLTIEDQAAWQLVCRGK
jgi:predicted ABC-type ATPase